MSVTAQPFRAAPFRPLSHVMDRFSVDLPAPLRDALDAIVAAHRKAAAAERASEAFGDPAAAPGTDTTTVAWRRRTVHDRLADRRLTGALLDTRTAVVTAHLRALLGERGWNTDWPPAPVRLPGRQVGVSPREHRTGAPREDVVTITVVLDPALAQTVRLAAYWVSEPAVRRLETWARRYGHGPASRRRRDPGLEWPDEQALAARERLRGCVVTTGDIMRAAIRRAVAGGTAS
ncbi:hypothetical protein AB0I28_32905 [Phytomonospora sp. NPDC050363]|uniref:hypothetical protein n=1 Tax=Phytomonospora sp. NPDC050363 TaxID=3155642 RepID=UPI00340AADDA